MPLLLIILGLLFVVVGKKKATATPSFAATVGDTVKNYVSQVETKAGLPTTVPPVVVTNPVVSYPTASENLQDFNREHKEAVSIVSKIPVVGQLVPIFETIGNLLTGGNYNAQGIDEDRARAMYGTRADGSIAFPTVQENEAAKTAAANQFFGIDQAKPIAGSLDQLIYGNFSGTPAPAVVPTVMPVVTPAPAVIPQVVMPAVMPDPVNIVDVVKANKPVVSLIGSTYKPTIHL